MTVNREKYPEFFDLVASEIDISPSKYQDAVNRYQAVGRWLEAGDYPGSLGQPSIYPQGSFRLGTVVRPIRHGTEASYDIDLVCEIPLIKHLTTPQTVKHMVGGRIRHHETYCRLLDPEGRRCWTLEYAERDGVGFHLDVLPAIPDKNGTGGTAVAITHKAAIGYSWSASDPHGYGDWFDAKNAEAFMRVVVEQKQTIHLANKMPTKHLQSAFNPIYWAATRWFHLIGGFDATKAMSGRNPFHSQPPLHRRRVVRRLTQIVLAHLRQRQDHGDDTGPDRDRPARGPGSQQPCPSQGDCLRPTVDSRSGRTQSRVDGAAVRPD